MIAVNCARHGRPYCDLPHPERWIDLFRQGGGSWLLVGHERIDGGSHTWWDVGRRYGSRRRVQRKARALLAQWAANDIATANKAAGNADLTVRDR